MKHPVTSSLEAKQTPLPGKNDQKVVLTASRKVLRGSRS
jgi:hypothetical protein